MSQKRIFIFEYISGGGFNKIDIPLSLFSEGFGMLRVIIEDFKALDFEIKTILDYRLTSLANQLECDFIGEINYDMITISEFKVNLRDCEYVFIIAPEFSNILFDYTKIAEKMDKKILSMNLNPILLGSSKFRTYKFFTNSKIPTPKSFILERKEDELDLNYIINMNKFLNPPVVLKPDDGVGAESVYYFKSLEQFQRFINQEKSRLDDYNNYIVQEYIPGEDLSASIIKNKKDGDFIILGINSQKIFLQENRIVYNGGITPYPESDKIIKKISKHLQKLDLSSFYGYFGIDFIQKTDGTISFIEINPRLTTSYIGIREVTKKNPLLLLVYPETDPNEIIDQNHNYISEYHPLRLNYHGTEKMTNLSNEICLKIPQILTPPLPFNEDSNDRIEYLCFIAIKAKNRRSLQNQKLKIFNNLEKFGFHIVI